jgi:Ca2+-binding EF-hand superfamily protein
MNKFLLGGAAAAALLAGGAALAATTETPQVAPTAKPMRAARQARAAQPLTRAAVQSRVAAVFAKLDTDHDGFITKEELNAIETAREQKVEQRAERFDPSKVFDRLDANHDGKITVAEADAARSQRAQAKGGQPAQGHASAFHGLFLTADTNKDNVLTRAEFDAMGEQLKARMEHASVARGGMATRMFDKADTNKDGRVTLAEMQQTALAQFDRADLNHDGTITPQERQQERQRFKSQRQPAQAPAKH